MDQLWPRKRLPPKRLLLKKRLRKRRQKKTTVKKKTAKTAEAKEAKPKKTKRKTRAKAAADVRKKVYWGVFNHAMKRVALYEFNQRKAAEKRAKELSPEGKPPHFVQKVKEDITE